MEGLKFSVVSRSAASQVLRFEFIPAAGICGLGAVVAVVAYKAL